MMASSGFDLTNLKNGLSNIANAIRTVLGTSTKYKFTDFPTVIKTQMVSLSKYNADIATMRQKCINAINSTCQIGNGTRVSQKGMVVGQVSCAVSNHDNSGEGNIGCAIYKNGAVMRSSGASIGAWSGGSCSCSISFTVNAGDTVSFAYWGDQDKSIFVNGSGSLSYTPNPF